MSENIGGQTGNNWEEPTAQPADSAEQQHRQGESTPPTHPNPYPVSPAPYSQQSQTQATTPIHTPYQTNGYQGYQAPQSQAPQSQAPQSQAQQAQTQPLHYGTSSESPATPSYVENPYFENQHAGGQYPESQYSENQYSQEQFRQNQPSQNQYSGSESYPHSLAPTARAEPKNRKKTGMGLFVGSVAAAALIGALVGGGTASFLGTGGINSASDTTQESAPLVINNSGSVNQTSAAAAKAMPSVVTISATSGNSGGTGSGVILNAEGYILTNTHVVTLDGAAAHATIQVQLSNGKVYAGTVVGTDPLSDLAVVKVTAPKLTPASLGNSSKLNVGDSVIAIGSPLGLNATVTEGIVSTLNRTIQVASSAVPSSPDDSSQDPGNGDGGFEFSPPGGESSKSPSTGSVNLNVIQTDAAINPGNSGGALVNAKGEIIGVNVAIASAGGSSKSKTQSGNIGVGFSIPIDHAKRIANEIIANGKATHGQLGVSVSGSSALGNQSQFTNGAVIASVTANGPAAKAGLEQGDIVTQLGDRLITDASSLTAAVRENAGAAKVAMTFIRDGKTMTKDLTLGTYSG